MKSFEAKGRGQARLDMSHDIFLRQAHVIEGTYSGQRGSFEALGCVFERCDFTRMRPRELTFASGREQTVYRNCVFDKSKLKNVVAGVARFETCSFLDIEIDGLFGHATEFVNCVFSGVLRHSVFFGRVSGIHRGTISRTTNEFRGNDFSAARFVDVDFREGVDLSLQRLPVGDNYLYLRNAVERLASLRRNYVQQTPSQRREEVFHFLKLVEDDTRQGQRDLLLCKDSFAHLSEQTIKAIWEELSKD
jgi:hypothetical protein